MTIRTRTLIIVAITLLGLLMALYVMTQSLMNYGFSTVEKKMAEGFMHIENRDVLKNIDRSVDALHATMENISTKLADWAQWDDTYRYVEDLNPQYKKSNLTPSALEALKLNFLAIVNQRGRIVFSYSYDLVKGEIISVPPDLLDHLRKEAPLLAHTDPQSLVEGIILLRQGPLMVTSRPIVTSEALGPIRGTLIFGQFLNDSALKRLEKVTHLSIHLRRLSDTALPADFAEAKMRFSPSDRTIVLRQSHDTLSGFTLVNDIYGIPSLIMRVSLPREIHQQEHTTVLLVHDIGRKMLLTLMLGMMAAGIGLGGVILFILEKIVLSRLSRLSSSAVDIGARKDFSARVAVEGTDELAQLGAAMNGMLLSLGATHEEIHKRTSEMRLIMDSVPIALLSLDTSLRINPEYSTSAHAILGLSNLAGLDFCDCLGLFAGGPQEKTRDNLRDFLDLFRNETLPEKDMAKLNPLPAHQLTVANHIRWLKIDYHLIRRGPAPGNHILAIIEDCTKAKALEQEMIKSQQENLQLKAIAEDPDLFCEFLSEARMILDSVINVSRRLSAGDEDPEPLHQMFRGIHTIKGIAGAFSLTNISDCAERLENALSLLYKKDHMTGELIERTRAEISELNKELETITDSSMKILRIPIDDDAGMSVRVAFSEFKNHIDTMKEMHRDLGRSNTAAAAATEKIIRHLEAMKMVPAVKAFGRATKIVPDLIRRVDKNSVFIFEGRETLIDYEIAHILNTPLVHLFRNAFDHGIEFPEERKIANKSEQGRVTLTVRNEEGVLVLEVSDDGAGIDPEKIKAIALVKKIIGKENMSALSPAECYDFLFLPGFSTRAELTDISGRGVGLDVVYDAVKNRLKGTIHVESLQGKGTRFTLRVPLESSRVE